MDKKVPPGRDDKKPGKKRTKVICLIAAILLLILMLLLLFRCCTVSDHGEPPVGPKVSDDVLVDGELETEKSESIDPQYFNIKVNATPTLQNHMMNLRIENPKKNRYACQVEVVAVLDNAEKTIYLSPKINPGQALEYCTVEDVLSPGNYAATAKYTIYELDSENVIGRSNVELNLIVNER